MAGRKPKPAAQRELEGNAGKRRIHQPPKPPPGTPQRPAHVKGEARAEWDRVIGGLVAMGVVAPIDRAVLAAYCICYGRWVRAEQKLAALGVVRKSQKGIDIQTPWVGIANRSLELMLKFAGELGLSPVARQRLAIISGGGGGDGEGEEADRFFEKPRRG